MNTSALVDVGVRVFAFHEAGHGCVATARGVQVRCVAVDDVAAPELGRVVTRQKFGLIPCEDLVLFFLAGGVAQERYMRSVGLSDHDHGDATDVADARILLTEPGDHRYSAAVDRELAVWRRRTELAVAEHWNWIHRVADQLVSRRWLSGDDIVHLRRGV
ncbi:MAG: hypothetical protein ABJA98_22110 [Acidobacteriota bacterium]